MTRPVITALPPAPTRGEDAATFAAKANTFVAALPAYGTESNALGQFVEEQADILVAAVPAAEAAISAAHYKGEWSTLSGALAIPASVSHNGSVWLLTVSVADVTAVEPGVSAVWINLLASGLNIGDYFITARDEEEVAENFLLADGAAYLQATYPALFDELGFLTSALDFSDVPKLTNPTDLPTGQGNDVAFSSDDTYMAVAHTTTPFITIYKRDGDTFTKLTNPTALPASTALGVAFSSDDTYLAVAHGTTPFVTIYKRDGDTFTKLTNPTDLPAGTGNGVAFSSDDTYMAVAHASSPFITIYKRDGDTFTKLTNPTALPANNGNGVAFSSDDTYMAVAHTTTPFITIYKRYGDTFTKLTNPAALPTGQGNGVVFSSDNSLLAIAHGSSPFITIYRRFSDTFSKALDPANLPTGTGTGVAFSSDDTYLADAHVNSPFITIYKAGELYDPATEFVVPVIEQAEEGYSKQLTFIKAED